MGARPNFLVVGAPKAGTTTIYTALRAHPEVFMSDLKEPGYFVFAGRELPTGPGDQKQRKVNSWDDYLSLFAGARDELAIGEASTPYLHCAAATARIVDELGTGVKIIVSLRDPVERAHSAYLQRWRNGFETLPFEASLEAGPGRAAAGWLPQWDWRAHGLYADDLERLFGAFGEDNVLVTLLDDLRHDSSAVIARICEFLGVSAPDPTVTVARQNPGGAPRWPLLYRMVANPPRLASTIGRVAPRAARAQLAELTARLNRKATPPMLAETRAALCRFYADDVARVAQLIGRDLSGWLHDDRSPAGRV